jgi:hypothetical protein
MRSTARTFASATPHRLLPRGLCSVTPPEKPADPPCPALWSQTCTSWARSAACSATSVVRSTTSAREQAVLWRIRGAGAGGGDGWGRGECLAVADGEPEALHWRRKRSKR